MAAASSTSPRSALTRAAVGLCALAALAGVFTLYSRPDFLVLMIDQLWSCF